MANKYRGVGVKWGVGVTAHTGIATFDPTKLSVSKKSGKKEFKGPDGCTKGVVYYDQSKELSLTVTPTATTLAGAVTVAQTLPEPGDIITITDSSSSLVAGTWLCDDASMASSNDSETTFDLKLVQYADATVQVAAT